MGSGNLFNISSLDLFLFAILFLLTSSENRTVLKPTKQTHFVHYIILLSIHWLSDSIVFSSSPEWKWTIEQVHVNWLWISGHLGEFIWWMCLSPCWVTSVSPSGLVCFYKRVFVYSWRIFQRQLNTVL